MVATDMLEQVLTQLTQPLRSMETRLEAYTKVQTEQNAQIVRTDQKLVSAIEKLTEMASDHRMLTEKASDLEKHKADRVQINRLHDRLNATNKALLVVGIALALLALVLGMTNAKELLPILLHIVL